MDDDVRKLIINLTCTPYNTKKRSQSCGIQNTELAPKLG